MIHGVFTHCAPTECFTAAATSRLPATQRLRGDSLSLPPATSPQPALLEQHCAGVGPEPEQRRKGWGKTQIDAVGFEGAN